MTSLVAFLLLFQGQLNTSKDVVRLPPNANTISQAYGGKLVELLNAADDVSLPPKPNLSSGITWSVDVKNLGPHAVTIRNNHQLTVVLLPNESATFTCRGSSTYVRTR
jgi:hypothetical protein